MLPKVSDFERSRGCRPRNYVRSILALALRRGTAVRSIALLSLLACVCATARAATDDETPQPPPPPPVEPIEAHLSLSVVLRSPSGFGVELAIYPVERLELGVQLASWLFVSEAGAYVRYLVYQHAPHGLNVGLRGHAISSLLNEDDAQPNPAPMLLSFEAGYEHRLGSSLFGVEAGTVIYDGSWLPNEGQGITAEIRFGHLW